MFRNRQSKKEAPQPTTQNATLNGATKIVWVGSHATPIRVPAK
jgi:hypothetical protein